MKLSPAMIKKSTKSAPDRTSKLPVGTVIPIMVAQQFNVSNGSANKNRAHSVSKAVSKDASVDETQSSGNTVDTTKSSTAREVLDEDRKMSYVQSVCGSRASVAVKPVVVDDDDASFVEVKRQGRTGVVKAPSNVSKDEGDSKPSAIDKTKSVGE